MRKESPRRPDFARQHRHTIGLRADRLSTILAGHAAAAVLERHADQRVACGVQPVRAGPSTAPFLGSVAASRCRGFPAPCSSPAAAHSALLQHISKIHNRFHFGWAAEPLVTATVAVVEATPYSGAAASQRALALLEAAEPSMTAVAKASWRWRLLYLRAKIDTLAHNGAGPSYPPPSPHPPRHRYAADAAADGVARSSRDGDQCCSAERLLFGA